jgi:hypothetical protein
LRRAAVERGGRGGALRRRALRGSSGDAVEPPVGRGRGAPGARGEVVVLVGEVPERGLQGAHPRRHGALEEVGGDVELLDGGHAGDAGRERALEAVAADVEDGDLAEQADLRRDAAGEGVVDEDDLVERGGHPPDGRRDAAAEAVVGEDDDGRGRVAEVGRDGAREAVVVEDDGVERAVEQRRRDGALEVVEAEVEVAQGREVEHHLRERADEAVVAEVELVEEPQVAERVREHAAEAVGVEVEQGEVGEAPEQAVRDVARDVGVVEVEPGDGELPVRRVRRAEDAAVAAHVRPHPVGGEVEGVGEDGGALPRLQREQRRAQPRRLLRGRRQGRVVERRDGDEEEERQPVEAPRAPGHWWRCVLRARWGASE